MTELISPLELEVGEVVEAVEPTYHLAVEVEAGRAECLWETGSLLP
jgi:hypothetical protein